MDVSADEANGIGVYLTGRSYKRARTNQQSFPARVYHGELTDVEPMFKLDRASVDC